MMYHDISTISPLAFALINNLADLTYPWGPIVEAKQTQSDRVKPAMAWLGYEANKRVIFWGIYEEIAEVCIDISRCIYIFCYIPCNSIYYSIVFYIRYYAIILYHIIFILLLSFALFPNIPIVIDIHITQILYYYYYTL